MATVATALKRLIVGHGRKKQTRPIRAALRLMRRNKSFAILLKRQVAVFSPDSKKSGDRMASRTLLQSCLDSVPVNVREEGFYILETLSRFVVEQEGVLPHVHHEHWIETRYVARLVQRDPMIGESTISWILEADGPTNAPHLADAYKIRLPNIVATSLFFEPFKLLLQLLKSLLPKGRIGILLMRIGGFSKATATWRFTHDGNPEAE